MIIMENKNSFIKAAISAFFTIVLIVLVRFVDVASIGPEGTKIGMSHLNSFFFNLFGVNIIWYRITDWLGIVAILTAFVFAVVGLVQLIKRRSLFKVDGEIIFLGLLYIIVIGLYILFELAIVNYRPIIMPDGTHPEASFPSSHTMIVCVIMGSTIPLIGKYIKTKEIKDTLEAACVAVMAVTVIGRLIAGVHWFTDICGGILISAALLALYAGSVEYINRRKTNG